MPAVSTPAPSRPSSARRPATLPEMLLAATRAHPEAEAVIAGDASLTFDQLGKRSRRLAGLLAECGVEAGDIVGIFAEPGVDLPLFIWGALHASAAYLPLAADYPDERLRYMLEHSGAKAILAEAHLASRIRDIAPHEVRVITPGPDLAAGHDVPALHDGGDTTALAYLIYTSGSTGRPKGVMIEHRSIVAQLDWLALGGHLRPGVRILQKTPTSFDAAQWEILAPAVGATVVMGVPEIHRNPYAIVELIGRHSVTALQCVPTLLQALLDAEGFEVCSSLTHVYSGGEALSAQLAGQFLEALPWCRLTNLYGPSECTINALSHAVGPEDLRRGETVIPIGRPVAGIDGHLLDSAMAPVADGEVGELYLSGVQVARGYIGNPDQTAERFRSAPEGGAILYRTGDLARRNADGTFQFMGRIDNQIKLRGYRVELEEIALTIEQHPWVRRAGVIVSQNERTSNPELVACVEMNPHEATLMDQGNHGGHHQSKTNKLQVKAQLSDPGIRTEFPSGHEGEFATRNSRAVLPLPGKDVPAEVRAEVFARKSYRFFDGGQTTRAELEEFLGTMLAIPAKAAPGEQSARTGAPLEQLGRALAWIGQFTSEERLLPKYSYASPGALYAVQAYLDLAGMAGVPDGLYYYHPLEHALRLIGPGRPTGGPTVQIHLIGRHGAIESVYKNNILEVLEFEAGHLLGALQDALAASGQTVAPYAFDSAHRSRCLVAEEDHYLGTFAIIEGTENHLTDAELVVNVPGPKIAGLRAGTYAWRDGGLERVADEVIQPKHVIAINQRTFGRSSFGISILSRAREAWLDYITMGCALHRAQRNGIGAGLGFMSSGYSSKSGNPLPTSRRLTDILTGAGLESGPSYFFLGGKVSPWQIETEGMYEDSVHMQGPAELIKEELSQILPDYMVPHRTVVFDELPLTPNGKIDAKALAASEKVAAAHSQARFVPPATPTEKRLASEWGELLRYDDVSTEDEFFAVGGNSLMSVTLIARIAKVFGVQLPLRTLIDTPRFADLALRIDEGHGPVGSTSRFISLGNATSQRPIYCWPGLGGYPMNLRALAATAVPMRPVYGIQSQGINAGERPLGTIAEMAAADIAEMRALQPEGPYTLWGYSFGARVAFEAAWQLEQAGETVDRLMLICPGNPGLRAAHGEGRGRTAAFDDPAFVTVLCSVFMGTSSGPDIDECLAATDSRESFTAFIAGRLRALDAATIGRIVDIVVKTYQFDYTFDELASRRLAAEITIFKAAGDDYSFIESAPDFALREPVIVPLAGDHYEVLREHGVDELADALRHSTYAEAGASASLA